MSDEKTEDPKGERSPEDIEKERERIKTIRESLDNTLHDMARVLFDQMRIMRDGRINIQLDIGDFKVTKAGFMIQRGFNYEGKGDAKQDLSV